MRLHAVVPVKDLASAKSRLAGTLSPDSRRSLMRLMLGRVLTTLTACSGVDRELAAVWVVSRDVEVLAVAANMGARPIRETGGGLNPALDQARKTIRAAQADAMLILPADVPLVHCDDVRGLRSALIGGADIVIAPDAAESGTNALGLWLSAALPFQFGQASFARHRALAAWNELIVEVYRSPTLALDVDDAASLDHYQAVAC
ncbi:MAG: 2-phospho-L-lactate guanylyltransferase [Oscillochloris sp.]|nr:2-phospho-L-lactate guanylyltransferase [Oscillochloris sp.]